MCFMLFLYYIEVQSVRKLATFTPMHILVMPVEDEGHEEGKLNPNLR